MLRQSLSQKLSQKLSPRQIQLMKLIQIPSIEMDSRIKEELELNPTLEVAENSQDTPEYNESSEDHMQENADEAYGSDNDMYSEFSDPFEYYYSSNSDDEDEDDNSNIMRSQESFFEVLMNQLDLLSLEDDERLIAEHVIGSIDEDGYLRRSVIELADDMAFKYNLNVEDEKVEQIIHLIQQFDPPGVGAHDLQECLILQTERLLESAENKDEKWIIEKAHEILKSSFTELSKKHFNKIIDRHKLSEESFKQINSFITKLSPKPGLAYSNPTHYGNNHYTQPDFFVSVDGDNLHVSLYNDYTPDLKVSGYYINLLNQYENQTQPKNKSESEAETFIKQKIDSAKWFIDALMQRKITLLTTMRAIAQKQINFFKTGNPNELQPMILKDIADIVKMDISTISRVSRSKYVQTQFGIFPLKFFFNDSFSIDEGEDVSVIKIRNLLKDIIDSEDKKHPFSDEKLSKLMEDKGFPIARRTVAKYRDLLGIPVAQMRKEL